ncbi:hypothetical protein [Achromobacter kerstersii]
MSKLCREYGLSDNGLRKLCQRLDVPVPERGYWAKKAVGKAGAQPELPALVGKPDSETVRTRDEAAPTLAMRPETKAILKEDIEFEQDVGHRVEVADLPMHEALVSVQQRLARRVKEWQKARKDHEAALQKTKNRPWEPNWSALNSGLRWPNFEENGGYLFLKNERCVARVTEKQTGRAVAILNAVAHAASSRGYTFLGPDANAGALTLRRRGVDTLLRLTEHATVNEVKDKSIFYAHLGGIRKEPHPTGKLRVHFRISTRPEKFVSDEDGPLEEQLNDLFARLAKAEAAYVEHLHRGAIQAKLREEAQARWIKRQQHLEEERKAQQLIETQLQREKEERESFLRDLCAEADAWRKSQSVECYLRHLREASGDSASSELREWLSRAEEAMRELDPTTRRLRN